MFKMNPIISYLVCITVITGGAIVVEEPATARGVENANFVSSRGDVTSKNVTSNFAGVTLGSSSSASPDTRVKFREDKWEPKIVRGRNGRGSVASSRRGRRRTRPDTPATTGVTFGESDDTTVASTSETETFITTESNAETWMNPAVPTERMVSETVGGSKENPDDENDDSTAETEAVISEVEPTTLLSEEPPTTSITETNKVSTITESTRSTATSITPTSTTAANRASSSTTSTVSPASTPTEMSSPRSSSMKLVTESKSTSRKVDSTLEPSTSEISTASGEFVNETGQTEVTESTSDIGSGVTEAATGEPSKTTTTTTTTPTTMTTVSDKKGFQFVVLERSTGIYCILCKMMIFLRVPYITRNETIATANLKVPQTASVSGRCSSKHSEMTLTWKEEESSPSKKSENAVAKGSNNLTMYFISDGFSFSVDRIKVMLYPDESNFPNATAKNYYVDTTSHGLGLFTASVTDGLYTCKLKTRVAAGSIDLSIWDVSLIAFNANKDFSSRSEENCIGNAKLNIAAIVGGIAGGLFLLGMILIVFWRRKNSPEVPAEVS